MAGWQAGLLVPAQTALHHVHVLLPVNTAAKILHTGHPLAQYHCSWQADCTAGWQAGLLLTSAQSVLQLQQVNVLLPAHKAANNLQYGHPPAQDHWSLHGKLISRAASACADYFSACARAAACEHWCRQVAVGSSACAKSPFLASRAASACAECQDSKHNKLCCDGVMSSRSFLVQHTMLKTCSSL